MFEQEVRRAIWPGGQPPYPSVLSKGKGQNINDSEAERAESGSSDKLVTSLGELIEPVTTPNRSVENIGSDIAGTKSKVTQVAKIFLPH
jgi:hypothetical protein